MAEKKFFVDVSLQGNNINNLRADTLDITSNLASANTKRIVYWSDQYYYSDGTTWNVLGGSENLAETLLLGNSAGATNINMNTNSIINIHTLNNSVSYPIMYECYFCVFIVLFV
jgi:hypothetical protein